MNDKLIIIMMNEEILDSFIKEFSELGLHFYLVHNSLNLVEWLEFEAFVIVCVKFK